MNKFNFGVDNLSVGMALDIARGKVKAVFNTEAENKITQSRAEIMKIVEKGTPLYGVNTGFGPLCTIAISKEKTTVLQVNILKSHSVGMGEPISKELSKLMMILKLHSLAYGFSGIALSTLKHILFLLENDIIPIVPEQGSVGASGDLAPLAHLFLPLIGLGKVFCHNKICDTDEAYRMHKIIPIELGPKEGLALINGTQFIAAHAIIALEKMHNCLNVADIIGAMSLESQLGSIKPFDSRLHAIRPFKGSILVANRMRSLLSGSEMVESHLNCDRVDRKSVV